MNDLRRARNCRIGDQNLLCVRFNICAHLQNFHAWPLIGPCTPNAWKTGVDASLDLVVDIGRAQNVHKPNLPKELPDVWRKKPNHSICLTFCPFPSKTRWRSHPVLEPMLSTDYTPVTSIHLGKLPMLIRASPTTIILLPGACHALRDWFPHARATIGQQSTQHKYSCVVSPVQGHGCFTGQGARTVKTSIEDSPQTVLVG